MTTTARQNSLILNEDWKRIYQTFKNADFKSYDFENIRRVMLNYIKEKYPEDFNDYVESSEYMALIDVMAFLGQSLAFRIDLASRENFIELAERKESVLRIARMLSYNPKRSISAAGLLKFTAISTTEQILDSNGQNLSQQLISWNDSSNQNWYEHFILILNAAMVANTEFGNSQGNADIDGIPTQQYRFNTSSSGLPMYTYSKSVAGRTMLFETVSTVFKNSEAIHEEEPLPGGQLGFVYRNDGRGAGSANTGFYVMFKQGSLQSADFGYDTPNTHEKLAIENPNINNDDIWLFGIGPTGVQTNQWAQVPTLVGDNIAYNSTNRNIRNVFSVITKELDKVDIVFADGVYGNLPIGKFRVYYRVGNALTYIITPNEMRGINISVPYTNAAGAPHTLSISLALQQSVTNASSSEGIDSIRANAPAHYYTQNRMITGEDYNLAPLASSQDIIKIKAVNRTSSGISRNFEIIDVSGKYSSINVFADDGFIYKDEIERTSNFKFKNKSDIINIIHRTVESTISRPDVYNFYISKFDKKVFDNNTTWIMVTNDYNLSTGYFINNSKVLRVGNSSTTNLMYISYGSMVQFIPPTGKAFKNGKLVDIDVLDAAQSQCIWTKVIRVVGDGTNANTGILASGAGTISFNDIIPSGSIISRVVPKFITNLPAALETEIVNAIFQNLTFGLRYDVATLGWHIITAPNLDLTSSFNLISADSWTNSNNDASWIIAFVKNADSYTIRTRALDYIFGSMSQNRFYFDSHEKSYNNQVGSVIKDRVKVLGINKTHTGIGQLVLDTQFDIIDTVKFNDGYESIQEIKLAFSDLDDDGVLDDPDSFISIVGNEALVRDTNEFGEDESNLYLFFIEMTDTAGNKSRSLVDTSITSIITSEFESDIDITRYSNGQLIYFYGTNADYVKQVNRSTNTLSIVSKYTAKVGRAGLKFQYLHNASNTRRIDPSSSNIIDVFLITRAYDTAFRKYISGAVSTMPEPPTSNSLRITFGTKLDSIKSISDEIIYHPVKYKILFGNLADEKLQAQFKVVKNPNKRINDNDLRVRIVSAINTFFEIANWDFGDRFYLSELTTYILNAVAPDISNIIIVPRQVSQAFGSLFEIQSKHDEILVSSATVDNIDIVTSISASEVRASISTIISST